MTPIQVFVRFCALTALGCAAALGGCQSGANRAAYGVSASQFQDMVVPAGMKLRDGAHESHSRQESNWRVGHFVYEGATSVDEAIGYVRQRMPQHNWTVVEDVTTDEQVSRLRFERGIYTAEYTFQRRDGATHMTVDYRTDYSRR